MRFLKSYLAALVAFLVLDSIWLGTVAVGFYQDTIGYLLREQFNFLAAGIFYAFYIAGVVHFVSLPASSAGRWAKAALNGAFFGLIAYGTYDLTNYATVRDWPFIVVVVDMIWGASVTATVAVTGYLAVAKGAANDAVSEADRPATP